MYSKKCYNGFIKWGKVMKHYGYGLLDKDGYPWSDCCTENEDFLKEQYDAAYPYAAPFKIVKLFYADEE